MSANTGMKISAIQTMRAPWLVVDDFLPAALAQQMRHAIERHFAEPASHRPDSHQVWNYWFVPGLHTYLRTTPDKVLQRGDVELFMEVLSTWSTSRLGLRQATWPYLSLYVSGCRQNLHNDSGNGAFAFVYSLTRNERNTTGGETIVLHEGDPFRSHLATPRAGRGRASHIDAKGVACRSGILARWNTSTLRDRLSRWINCNLPYKACRLSRRKSG